jgi:hypothetical protein
MGTEAVATTRSRLGGDWTVVDLDAPAPPRRAVDVVRGDEEPQAATSAVSTPATLATQKTLTIKRPQAEVAPRLR